jgi:hypothetical protein
MKVIQNFSNIFSMIIYMYTLHVNFYVTSILYGTLTIGLELVLVHLSKGHMSLLNQMTSSAVII